MLSALSVCFVLLFQPIITSVDVPEPLSCLVDQTYLATLSDASLVLYQPEQEPVTVYDSPEYQYIWKTWSPDGRYIAYQVGDSLSVYDIKTDDTIQIANGFVITGQGWYPSENRLWLEIERMQIMSFDLASGALNALTEPVSDASIDVKSLSPDGRYLFYEYMLRVDDSDQPQYVEQTIFDHETGESTVLVAYERLPYERWFMLITWAPNERHAIVTFRKSAPHHPKNIYKITNSLLRLDDYSLTEISDTQQRYLWTDDGQGFYMVDDDNHVIHYDVDTQAISTVYESAVFNVYLHSLHGDVLWLGLYDPDLDFSELDSITWSKGIVSISPDETKTLIMPADSRYNMRGIQVSPRNTYLATVAVDVPRLTIYEWETGETIVLNDELRAIRWLDDSLLHYVYAATESGAIYSMDTHQPCDYPNAPAEVFYIDLP